MEHFELVEKLVNTFGVSYEKAKEALENSSWDPVEAAVILEREKNGIPQDETYQEGETEIPRKGPKGSTVNIPVDEIKEESSKFFKTIWDFLSLNSFVVKKSTGEIFLDIPIWLAALLLCAFFWAIVVIMVIVYIMGYRFSFSGPHLGKKNVKNTVSQVEKSAEDLMEKVKNAVAPDTCEPVPDQTESKDDQVNEEKKEETETETKEQE